MLDFQTELAPVVPASRISLQTLHKEATSLVSEIRSLKSAMDKLAISPPADDDPFLSIMKPFLNDAQSTTTAISAQLEVTQSNYEKCLSKYGEDKNEQSGCVHSSEVFFGIFKQFLLSFQKALAECRKSLVLESQRDKRDNAVASLPDPLTTKRDSVLLQPSTMDTNNAMKEENEKGVMDSILETLKRGANHRSAVDYNRTMSDLSSSEPNMTTQSPLTQSTSLFPMSENSNRGMHDLVELRKVQSRLRRTDVLSAYAALPPSPMVFPLSVSQNRSATVGGRNFSMMTAGQVGAVHSVTGIISPATVTTGTAPSDVE